MAKDSVNPLAINLFGIDFKNPVIAASGTFGYGLEFAEEFDLSLLGGISVKGLSLKPTHGNPTPRVRETHAGMLNAIGLENVGVETFLSDKLPKLKQYDTKIIANFWGRSIEEYVETAKILDGSDVDLLEMNISCPNVKEGGILFSSKPEITYKIVSKVRQNVKHKKLIVKLSPNVTDIKEYAAACEEAGANGVTAINTLLALAIDIKTRKPHLASVTGGLSGPAIKPIAVRMVYEIYKTVKIPIIGVGGIMEASDVVEFFLAGASAVEVGTANFVEHSTMPVIIEELKCYCHTNGIKNVSELSGGMLLT
jgi:dihydroorotate dehydrogenase (NAD+) catalytic subunit